MVRGHSFAHDTRCPGVGKPGHVQPYFGEDDLRTMWPDAGDLIEASHRRQQRGLGAPSRQVGVYGDQAAVGGVAVAGFGGLRVGHGGPLDLHLAARQIGEPAWIAFPFDEGLDHVAGR
jgi:hypothetical protein